jgi:hypothetical protein
VLFVTVSPLDDETCSCSRFCFGSIREAVKPHRMVHDVKRREVFIFIPFRYFNRERKVEIRYSFTPIRWKRQSLILSEELVT